MRVIGRRVLLAAPAAALLPTEAGAAGPVRGAIDATKARFVQLLLAGDAAGLAQLYTENARLLPPGSAMLAGRSAIAAYWTHAIPELNAGAARLLTLEVISQESRAQELGRGEITPRGAETAIELKYVVLWRQVGGAWRIDVHIWNRSE